MKLALAVKCTNVNYSEDSDFEHSNLFSTIVVFHLLQATPAGLDASVRISFAGLDNNFCVGQIYRFTLERP